MNKQELIELAEKCEATIRQSVLHEGRVTVCFYNDELEAFAAEIRKAALLWAAEQCRTEGETDFLNRSDEFNSGWFNACEQLADIFVNSVEKRIGHDA